MKKQQINSLNKQKQYLYLYTKRNNEISKFNTITRNRLSNTKGI